MPGQVYAVASGKGGVGKTTTVVNLGVALRIDGRSVALVDADLGMANVAAFLGLDHEPTVHDVLAGEAAVADAVAESADGFAVVPGARSLDAFAAADPAGLDEVLEHVARRYDVVLVDTGAGVGYEELLPLGLVDGVVLVTTPDPAAVGDTRKTARLVERLGRSVRGVVVNRADEGGDGEAVADTVDEPLLGVVPEDPALTESSAAGTPVRSADPEAPSVTAFDRVADRLLGGGPASVTDEREPAADDDAAPDVGDGGSIGVADETATPVEPDDATGETGHPVDEGDGTGDEKQVAGDGSTSGAIEARAGAETAETADPAATADDGARGATAPTTADRVDPEETGDVSDGEDTDEGPALDTDIESERGFVTTGSVDSDGATAATDAAAAEAETATETVLAEGDGPPAVTEDNRAAAGEESDGTDERDEASGGLFSWFR